MSSIFDILGSSWPFLVLLGVLVFVHELGHFVVARWNGVRCLIFSLGFGPKLLQTKRGDTVYCVSVIPLGGYVKMAGETPDDQSEGKDDEFMSKTKWQRFQILIAGPAMNLILAVVVMTGVLYQGARVPVYLQAPPIVGIVDEDTPAAAVGLQSGDRILSVAGRDVNTWDELAFAVGSRADRQIDVVFRRGSEVRTVQVTPASTTDYNVGDLGVRPDTSPQIIAYSASSAARDAGLLLNDIIEAVEGEEVTQETLITKIQGSANVPLTFQIRRDGRIQDVVVTPRLVGDVGLIGVSLSPFEQEIIEPGPFEAFVMSLEQNYEWSGMIFQTLGGLFTRDTPMSQLVGPVGIAQLSDTAADTSWAVFFGLMAMISLNLGILNLLPIPILDGGHIFIMAMEGVARRDFSVQLKERMLLVGFVVLLSLMITVIYNDFTRVAWIERLMFWR